MLNPLKKLWNDKRGNVLIIMGAALPLLVGAAGIATDTIQWALWKRQLQRAADSGAVAGVYTRITDDTEAAVSAAVTTDLGINNHVGIPLQSGYPDIDLLADDGDKEYQVQVTLQISKRLPFSAMFMASVPNIRATATAASVPGADEFCVLATDSSAGVTGIEITGSTKLDLGTCSLMTNSKHPSQAASNGNSGGGSSGSGSSVTAKSLAAQGGVKYSSSWDIDDYDPNSPEIADPLAGMSVPTCTKHVTIDMTKNNSYPMDRTTGVNADVAGDVVCFDGAGAGKLGLKVQGALKLQSGVSYVVNGGDVVMNSTGSSITCDGCSIFLTNVADPANTGNIKITGGTLDIKAPTEGDYAGIALFQDRLATDSGSASQNVIQGNNGASIQGVIYMGNRSLEYTGGSDTTFACLQIVSKRVKFTGNSAIALTSSDACKDLGMTAIGGGRRVRLVS